MAASSLQRHVEDEARRRRREGEHREAAPRTCARRACGPPGRARREARRSAPGDRRRGWGAGRPAGRLRAAAWVPRLASSRPWRRRLGGGAAAQVSRPASPERQARTGHRHLGPGLRLGDLAVRRVEGQARARPRPEPAGQVVGVLARLPEGRGGQRRAVAAAAVEDHRPVPGDRLRLAASARRTRRGGRRRSCPLPLVRRGRRSASPRRPRAARRLARRRSRSRWPSPRPRPQPA